MKATKQGVKTGLATLLVGVLTTTLVGCGAGQAPLVSVSSVPVQTAGDTHRVAQVVNVPMGNKGDGRSLGDAVQLDHDWSLSFAHIQAERELESVAKTLPPAKTAKVSKLAKDPEYQAHLKRLAAKNDPAYQEHLKRLAAKQEGEKAKEAKKEALLRDPEYQAHLKRLALKNDPAYQSHLVRLSLKQEQGAGVDGFLRAAEESAAQAPKWPVTSGDITARPDYDPVSGQIITPKDRAVDQIPRFEKTLSARNAMLVNKLLSGGRPYKDADTMENALEVKATAYVADCIGCSGITRTGLDVRRDTPQIIAVDPTVIPLGTYLDLWVEGVYFGVYRAADTGGAIKGAKIDVLLETAGAAMDFGTRQAVVKVHTGDVKLQPVPKAPTPEEIAAWQTRYAAKKAAEKEQEQQAHLVRLAAKQKAEKAEQAAVAAKELKTKQAEEAAKAKDKAKAQAEAKAAHAAKVKSAALQAAKVKAAAAADAKKAAELKQEQAAKRKEEAAPKTPAVGTPAKQEEPKEAESVDDVGVPAEGESSVVEGQVVHTTEKDVDVDG